MCAECHTVTIKTEVKHLPSIVRALERLKFPDATRGTQRFYDGTEKEGVLLHLPGWNYPAVIDTDTGEVFADNFEGQWGDIAHLNKFLQAYAAEVTIDQAQRQGYAYTQHALEDGSLQIRVQVQQ